MSNSKIIFLHVFLIILVFFSFHLLGNQISSFGKSLGEKTSSQENVLEEKNTPIANPI